MAKKKSELDGSKWQEDLTEKQLSVLEAAIDVFAEKGFAAASTSEIAKRAGVAEGTVFKRYATKKALLLEIGLLVAKKFGIPSQIKELQEILDRPYPRIEDLMRAFLKNRLETATRMRKLLKVGLQELPFHPELQKIIMESAGKNVVPAAIQAVERFKQSGQIKKDIPSETILRMIASQFLSYVLLRVIMLPDRDWDDEREIELIVSTLMRGLSA